MRSGLNLLTCCLYKLYLGTSHSFYHYFSFCGGRNTWKIKSTHNELNKKQFLGICALAVHRATQLLSYLNIPILKGRRPRVHAWCLAVAERVKANPIFMALDFKSQGDFTERTDKRDRWVLVPTWWQVFNLSCILTAGEWGAAGGLGASACPWNARGGEECPSWLPKL